MTKLCNMCGRELNNLNTAAANKFTETPHCQTCVESFQLAEIEDIEVSDTLDTQNTDGLHTLSPLSPDKIVVGCRLRSKITGVDGTVVEFNKNTLVKGVSTTVPVARVLWDNGKQNTVDLSKYVSAWFINDTINHGLIIDELIKCVKLNRHRKPEDHGISTDYHIREFHTVGLKTTRQVGLTTYVRTQITKGSKACVITNQPIFYDEDTENVFDIDQQSMGEMSRVDTGLTTFFVGQHAVPSGDKLRLYRYLYSIAGEELIIIELYS